MGQGDQQSKHGFPCQQDILPQEMKSDLNWTWPKVCRSFHCCQVYLQPLKITMQVRTFENSHSKRDERDNNYNHFQRLFKSLLLERKVSTLEDISSFLL